MRGRRCAATSPSAGRDGSASSKSCPAPTTLAAVAAVDVVPALPRRWLVASAGLDVLRDEVRVGFEVRFGVEVRDEVRLRVGISDVASADEDGCAAVCAWTSVDGLARVDGACVGTSVDGPANVDEDSADVCVDEIDETSFVDVSDVVAVVDDASAEDVVVDDDNDDDNDDDVRVDFSDDALVDVRSVVDVVVEPPPPPPPPPPSSAGLRAAAAGCFTAAMVC